MTEEYLLRIYKPLSFAKKVITKPEDFLEISDPKIFILSDDEVVKLEFWVRLSASVSSQRRNLTVIANSAGPIFDINCFREEPIRRHSQVASVRAFNAGKPMKIGIEDLKHGPGGSRWKSFFCVPIFHEEEYESAIMTIPVGCVTISSTLPLRQPDDQQPAAFLIL